MVLVLFVFFVFIVALEHFSFHVLSVAFPYPFSLRSIVLFIFAWEHISIQFGLGHVDIHSLTALAHRVLVPLVHPFFLFLGFVSFC